MQRISAKMTPGGSLQWDADMANSSDEDAMQAEFDTKLEGNVSRKGELSDTNKNYGYRV